MLEHSSYKKEVILYNNHMPPHSGNKAYVSIIYQDIFLVPEKSKKVWRAYTCPKPNHVLKGRCSSIEQTWNYHIQLLQRLRVEGRERQSGLITMFLILLLDGSQIVARGYWETPGTYRMLFGVRIFLLRHCCPMLDWEPIHRPMDVCASA